MCTRQRVRGHILQSAGCPGILTLAIQPRGDMVNWARATLLALVCMLRLAAPAGASVRVVVGPTPIVDGDARAASDITVINEKLAFALAVGSAVPYGVPRGAIVDVAPVRAGVIGHDRVVFADFIPNNWSAWPNTYQHVDILSRGPQAAVIRIARDWGDATVTTLYTLRPGSDHIELQTTMRNAGAAPMPALLSGFTLWPKGGFVFPVPGLQGKIEGAAHGALADRVVAYDEHWAITLHAPYLDHIAHSSLDLYRLHSLLAGQSAQFEGSLQVGSSADLQPVIREEITQRHLASGVVKGLVRSGEQTAVAEPVIVIEKQGQPYGWVLGHAGSYELTLPVGDYALYATARQHSQSASARVHVSATGAEIRNFQGVDPPGNIELTVMDSRNARPLDARIVITRGQKPLVQYLGRKTFFTDLDRKGHARIVLAPGEYALDVGAGGGFLSRRAQPALRVQSGRTTAAKVPLTPLFDPPARGWYSADLHHHADQAEAVTPPADLARSQLAAGLDVLFVSDHDSTVNLPVLQAIAERRGVPFLPGIELSPSWGHFNAYPVLIGKTPAIDMGTATIDQLMSEARRLGAIVVQVNHPLISYGYFSSLDAGVAPGGFNPTFDLIEINAAAPDDDEKVFRVSGKFWNGGHRYYLAAGTDTHDVWNDVSGRVRTFAHVEGEVTATQFARALQSGHAYVSYGPLIFPSVMFGTQRRVRSGESLVLGFDLDAIEGMKSFTLIGSGKVVDTRTFAAAPQHTHVDISLTVTGSGWYAVQAADRRGHQAFTDPIWVDVVSYPPGVSVVPATGKRAATSR